MLNSFPEDFFTFVTNYFDISPKKSIALADEPIDTVRAAQDILRLRRKREQRLGADLFADPVWDILLDLYVAHYRRNHVSVSSACLASMVPATTALRWLANLERKKMIVREPDRTDGRRYILSLSPDCLVALNALLLEWSRSRTTPNGKASIASRT
jgi:DNA-binding MarR family transcriptional regulator